MKRICLLFLCFFIFSQSYSQLNRYLVKFKDKATNPYSLNNPAQFLSQRALDRRSRYNINIDSTDLPVTPRYVDSVRLAGDILILNVSKWLNQVSVFTTDAVALSKIQSMPFVESAVPIASRNTASGFNKILKDSLTDTNPILNTGRITGNYFDYGLSDGQIRLHHGQFLHNHGFRGEGMQLAVIDAGFYHYNNLPTFDSAIINNRILGTWDFVDREESVSEDDSHGMHCLSTIAADLPGVFVGTAPKTSFYLFRTEDVSSEYPIEEHNLSAGAEKADSLGVDVCSISLGYTLFSDPSFDYTYNDMNGQTTMSAKAVTLAAKKGLLMHIAAGNEGNSSWHYISTPADADSCLSIAAVDTLGAIASFSSYGPSSDGRTKPNLAAVGRSAVVANSNTGLPTYGSGTSYACPNMAGISTCLWQAFPEASNMQIIDVLEKSGSVYNNPNNRIGYGIPNAMNAFVRLQKYFSVNHSTFNDCKATLDLSIKTDSTMTIEIERKLPGETNYSLINSIHNYEPYGQHFFTYVDDLTGTNYSTISYRYKMIIDSDTSFFIDSVILNCNVNCTVIVPTTNSLLITPNPVIDFLNIKMDRITNVKVDIVIHNAAGQKVYTTSFPQTIGSSNTLICFSRFSSGTYFVTVFLDDKKERTQKIIKQ